MNMASVSKMGTLPVSEQRALRPTAALTTGCGKNR